jgi:hypothetical protein
MDVIGHQTVGHDAAVCVGQLFPYEGEIHFVLGGKEEHALAVGSA